MKNIVKLILSLGDVSQDYMVLVDKNLRVAWGDNELNEVGCKKVKGKLCKDVFKNNKEYCDVAKVKKALDKNQVIKYKESSVIPITVDDNSFALVVSKGIGETEYKLKPGYKKIKVSEVMTKNIVSIPHTSILDHASNLMSQKKISSIIITKKSDPVGIITERDIVKFFSKVKDLTNVKVEKIMSKPIISINHDMGISDVGKIFAKHKIRRLIVKKGKKLAGIVTETDILKGATSQELLLDKERIEAEEKLKKSEEKYKIISEISSDFAYSFKIIKGKLESEWVTGAFEKITGYGFEEIKKKGGWASLIHPDDFSISQTQLKSILQSESTVVEYRIKTKSGNTRWFRDYAQAKKDEKTGKLTHIYGAVQDITQQKSMERELSKNEERYKTIIEHGNDLFYIHDTNHILTYVSSQSKELLGYTQEEMMINWTNLVTDNPINNIGVEITEKAIKTGKKQETYLLELKHKNGSKLFFEVDESPIKNEKGKVIGISGAIRDVTEGKRVEQNLKESEEKFKGIFNSAAEAIFIANSKTKKIVDCNIQAVNLMGFSKDEILKMKADQLHPKDLINYTINIFEKQAKGEKVIAETEIITKKKKRTPVSISTALISIGQEPFLMGIFRDVTEQKKSEKALKESEEKYRSLIDNTPGVAWTSDDKGNTLFISNNVEKIYGYKPEEICKQGDKLWFDRIHPEDIEYVIKAYQKIFAKHEKFDIEYRIKRKDEKWIWLQDTSEGSYKKKGKLFASGVFFDITEKKKTEEEKENLTAELQQRVTDLERFQRLTVGRELRMIELKNKIRELESLLKRKKVEKQ